MYVNATVYNFFLEIFKVCFQKDLVYMSETVKEILSMKLVNTAFSISIKWNIYLLEICSQLKF